MSDLQSRIMEILRPVAETYGVAAWNLGSNERILINENEVFPSASVIKLPILVELFYRRDEGGLSLENSVRLANDMKVGGSGVLKELHEGTELTVLDLAVLMIVVSDNTATNILIDLLGIESVNNRLRALGLEQTILQRRMFDFEQAKLGKENFCSPYDLMLILKLLVEGSISSKFTSMEMLEIMARQQCKEKIPLLLPDDVLIASKSGGIPGVSHDVAVVYTCGEPYILCIMTKGVSDRVAANRAIAEVSKVIYEHFCS